MKVLITLPTKSGCTHMYITDLSGNPLTAFQVSELKAAPSDMDDWMLRMLKYIVKKAAASSNAQIRTAIQAEDF